MHQKTSSQPLFFAGADGCYYIENYAADKDLKKLGHQTVLKPLTAPGLQGLRFSKCWLAGWYGIVCWLNGSLYMYTCIYIYIHTEYIYMYIYIEYIYIWIYLDIFNGLYMLFTGPFSSNVGSPITQLIGDDASGWSICMQDDMRIYLLYSFFGSFWCFYVFFKDFSGFPCSCSLFIHQRCSRLAWDIYECHRCLPGLY